MASQQAPMVLHSAWLQKHATKVYTRYRGKCVVIAGEELFAADIPEEAWGLAATAHPEDEGSFMRYIPCETVARICANHRCGETSRGDSMTYDVILRKQQNKYIARVRDWPEVMIEEETREAAIAQIKQQLTAYLSQSPEVIQIELEPAAPGAHPWLQFAGMWADDPTWDDFVAEVAAYRQEMDKADAEA